MKRRFLFGLGSMLIVTAMLALLVSASPDNKSPVFLTVLAAFLLIIVALLVLAFASNAPSAKRRWSAIAMWFLGFIIGFPLGNLVINGAVLAMRAALP